MIERFFNNIDSEQKEVFSNILKSYLFEANDYANANRLGLTLTKALPSYFFRCIPLPDDNDVMFRIFHTKTSFTTPITVSKYSEFIKELS